MKSRVSKRIWANRGYCFTLDLIQGSLQLVVADTWFWFVKSSSFV